MIISPSLNLPWDDALFSDSAHLPRLLTDLAAEGLRRVICEGGPHLRAAVVEAGAVDEADLTISSVMIGGYPDSRTALLNRTDFTLRHLIEDDGFLFTRYIATRDGAPGDGGLK